MPNTYVLTYYPWITQGPSPEVIRAAVQVFADALRDELVKTQGAGVTVQVMMLPDVPPQIVDIAAQSRHIALLNPLGYAFARRRNANVDVAAVALRKDASGTVSSTYRAQIYTAKRSGIRDLAGIKGHSLGFGVPFSTSNFLMPAALLKSGHFLFSVSSTAFLGGHNIVARAVYDGKVDVGAGHDGVITDLAAMYGYGDADERLRRLAWTDPIPSDPVVVNIPDLQERAAVSAAIVAAGSRPEIIRTAIAVFWGGAVGLGPTSAASYSILDQTLQQMAFDQDDLLIG
jgi:phosphonate transport system substrate-binding protein